VQIFWFVSFSNKKTWREVYYKLIQARIKIELYLKIILDLIKTYKVKDA
jgi:hypothetical protein